MSILHCILTHVSTVTLRHQLLHSASSLEIVGVSGNNKLAITLIPVNKCIILSVIRLPPPRPQ